MTLKFKRSAAQSPNSPLIEDIDRKTQPGIADGIMIGLGEGYGVRLVWDMPFDPSMLDGRVLIFCPNGEKVSELMELLGECGVKWESTNRLASCGNNNWDARKERTCYRVCFKQMGYSSIDFYEREGRFWGYIKCTFYGADTSDFEVASDDELTTLLGIGGA